MITNWNEAVLASQDRISGYIRKTDLEYSPSLSAETGAKVYFKLEMLQHTGSFKLRGAVNKLLSLHKDEMAKGVITASTGNHGAAVLHIARQLGVQVEVFLPKNASAAKVEKLRKSGATITQVGSDSLFSEQEARKKAESHSIPFISPYNDEDIICGQGTMTLEILEDLPNVDSIFVPVGGGGLISGAGAALIPHPHIELIGCQPLNSPVMQASVEAGKIVDLPSIPTLSDGTGGGLEADAITFPLCQKWVDRFISVSETEISAAMYSILKELNFVIEGAAGLSLAALRQQKEQYQGKTVVLVLCGRNVSMEVVKQVVLAGGG